MYWNNPIRRPSKLKGRLIETWDVLKYLSLCQFNSGLWINRNMRCIEMKIYSFRHFFVFRLIETWDVLKSIIFPVEYGRLLSINRNMRCIEIQLGKLKLFCKLLINRNMRCIEMGTATARAKPVHPINRNMRCIEIYGDQKGILSCLWLIETWDVLKFISS